MPKRLVQFIPGEYYHIYNRGVDGRDIILDLYDAERLVLALRLFNTAEPIGSIYAQQFISGNSLSGPAPKLDDPLVSVIDYCFNPNHFHLLLREVSEGGIVELMKRLGGGYSSYFNARYDRKGTLYQGRFQAKHIDTDEYFRWVHVYVARNDHVHSLSGPAAKLVRSSWGEYTGESVRSLCSKDVINEMFSDKEKHKKFADEAIELMRIRKDVLDVNGKLGVL